MKCRWISAPTVYENAVRIAEIQGARMFPGEHAEVTSVSFYHLALADERLKEG